MGFKLLVLALLVAILLGPRRVAADFSAGNFTTNLVSDFGPLVSLFGQEFAKQFLSESYTLWDHIMFAMAPIGFITALIGAIRVAGPPFLQALIGRARENKGKAEVEMMSSVSREVCELWNGKAVIRATGKPEIKQIIHIPKFAGDIRPKSFITLDPKSQTDDYQLTNSNGSSTNNPPDNLSHAEADLASKKPEANPDKIPPNISLNSHDQKKPSELVFFAILAILIQAAPLMYSGFLKKPALSRNPILAASYLVPGLIMYISSTAAVILSMFMCASIIESCSKKIVWVRDIRSRPRGDGQDKPAAASSTQSEPENKPTAHSADDDVGLAAATATENPIVTSSPTKDVDPRLVDAEQNGQTQEAQAAPPTVGPTVVTCPGLMYPIWIQKKLPSGDQPCGPFFLSSPGPRKLLITSTRDDDSMDSHWSSLLTTLAVLIGTLGFIGQLEGLRLVNWTVALAQFGATLFVTAIRAAVRRDMLIQPISKEIRDKYELDDLALSIVANRDWSVNQLGKANSPSLTFKLGVHDAAFDVHFKRSGSTAQKLMDLRARLGGLTGWKSDRSAEAIVLADSINTVFQVLKPDFRRTWAEEEGDDDGDNDENDREDEEEIPYVRIMVDTGKGLVDKLSFKLIQTSTGNYGTVWQVDAAEIEAALSLATSQIQLDFETKEKIQLDSVKSHDFTNWIRTTDTDFPDAGYRHVPGLMFDSASANLEYWIKGFQNSAYLEGLHDSTLIGATMEHFDLSNLRQPYPSLEHYTYQDEAVLISSQRPLLTYLFSAFMAAMGNCISNNTFSDDTICEVNKSVLFSPSLQNKKLNDIVQRVENHGLASSEDILTTLIIPLTYHNKLPSEKMLFSSRELLDLAVKNCDWVDASTELDRFLLTLENRGSMDRFTLRMAALCNELREHFNEAHKLEAPAQDHPIMDKISSVDITLLNYRNKYPQFEGAMAHVDSMRSAITNRLTPVEDVERLCESENFYFENNTNALGWTQGTFRCLTGDAAFFDTSTDMLGRTALHYLAAFGAHLTITHSELGLVNIQDKLGQLPLHRAAQYGHLKQVETLLVLNKDTINMVDNVDSVDNAKRTPLCLAVWNGDVAVVNFLISEKAKIHHLDLWKQTPLILAARNGKVDAFKILLKALLKSSSAEDIFHLDVSGKSALFWAKGDATGIPNQPIIDAFYDVMTEAKANMTEDFSRLYESHIEMASDLNVSVPLRSDLRARADLLDQHLLALLRQSLVEED